MVDSTIIPTGRNCTVCGEWQTADNFWISRRDGVMGRCKKCTRAYKKKYRAQNRERLNAKQRARTAEAWKAKGPPRVDNTPLVTEAGRLCSKCGGRFSLAHFTKHAGCRDGLARRCNACARKQHAEWRERNQEHTLAAGRAAQQRGYWSDPEKARLKLKKDRFGLTAEGWARMLVEQGHRCAICRCEFENTFSSNQRACVDHCHSTGKIRGILCNACNTALGMLKDNPDIVDAASAYLRRNT